MPVDLLAVLRRKGERRGRERKRRGEGEGRQGKGKAGWEG